MASNEISVFSAIASARGGLLPPSRHTGGTEHGSRWAWACSPVHTFLPGCGGPGSAHLSLSRLTPTVYLAPKHRPVRIRASAGARDHLTVLAEWRLLPASEAGVTQFVGSPCAAALIELRRSALVLGRSHPQRFRWVSTRPCPVSASAGSLTLRTSLLMLNCASNSVTVAPNSRLSRPQIPYALAPQGAVVTLMVRPGASNAPHGGCEQSRSDALTGLKPKTRRLRSTRFGSEDKHGVEPPCRHSPSDALPGKPFVGTPDVVTDVGATRPLPPDAGPGIGGPPLRDVSGIVLGVI